MRLETTPRARIVALQAGALSVCAILILAWAGGTAKLSVAIDENCPFLGTDFLLHYYPTITNLEPDAVWYYPPTLAILLTPLGWMHPNTANPVWLILQLALLAVWAIVPPHLVRGGRAWIPVGYTVATVVSIPVLQNVVWGQVSTGLALAGLFAFVLLGRRPLLAGVTLGLATAAKVYPLLWLAWPLARRSFRAVGAGLVTAVTAAGLLPIVVLGWAETVAFYRTVAEHLAHSLDTWIPTNDGPQYLPAVIGRLTGKPPALEFAIVSWILAAALLVLLARMRSDESGDRDLRAFAVAAGLFAFLVRTSWLHYFVHLPIAWLVLAHGVVRAARLDRIVIGSLLAVSLAFSSLPWRQFVVGGVTGRYAAGGWLAWANIAALAGIAWLVLRPRVNNRTDRKADP